MTSLKTTKDGSELAVVVTGGARGIGHAFAQRLAQDGFHVAVVDMVGAEDSALQLVRAGFSAKGYTANVTKADDWDMLLNDMIARKPFPVHPVTNHKFHVGPLFFAFAVP